MSLEDHINKLNSEIEKNQKELATLEKLKAQFPDLRVHINRWKTQRYYSALANELAEHYDMKHNCGCCGDSPLEVWPYTEYEGQRVYSDPPVFTVGENSYFGDVPHEGWEDKLRVAKIKEKLIDSIQIHFDFEKSVKGYGDDD